VYAKAGSRAPVRRPRIECSGRARGLQRKAMAGRVSGQWHVVEVALTPEEAAAFPAVRDHLQRDALVDLQPFSEPTPTPSPCATRRRGAAVEAARLREGVELSLRQPDALADAGARSLVRIITRQSLTVWPSIAGKRRPSSWKVDG